MDRQRELSLELFTRVKPLCVELSKETLGPGTINLDHTGRLLQKLSNELKVHYDEYNQKGYLLSDKLADYIFMPLSGLLKRDSLVKGDSNTTKGDGDNDDGDSVAIIGLILFIIGFLLDHCWRYSPDNDTSSLQDQLFPLVLYLVEQKQKRPVDFDFTVNGVYCVGTLLDILPGDYFTTGNQKRLALLGNTISYLLDTLTNLTSPVTQEELQLVEDILKIVQRLFAWKLNADQLSMVLPGTVSKLVNFVIDSKSVHFTVIISIIKVLKELIVKVFTITNIQVDIERKPESLNDLWNTYVKKEDTTASESASDSFLITHIVSNEGPRTDKWLRATSQQLKLTLVAFFKHLIMSSTNKRRLETKPQVVEEIISFIESIVANCFLSLFNEIYPLLIDIASLTLDTTHFANEQQERSRYREYSELFIQPQNWQYNQVIFDLLELKLKDMISSKLSSVLLLADDDRVKGFFIGLKFQLFLFQTVNKTLLELSSESVVTEMVCDIVQLLQLNVVECVATAATPTIQSKDLLQSLNSSAASSSSNKLDNIELPSYVNANKLVKVDTKKNLKQMSKLEYVSNLMILSKQWENDDMLSLKEDGKLDVNKIFDKWFSVSTENNIESFLRFVSSMIGDVKSLDLLESLGEPQYDTMNNTVSLWIANTFLSSLPDNSSNYMVDDFLYFDDDEDEIEVKQPVSTAQPDDHRLNFSYFVMYRSQELIDKVSDLIRMPESVGWSGAGSEYHKLEMSYATAISSIGILSKQIPHEDFQTDFLINYLYPLLEALTFQQNPLIQTHAASSVAQIINTHYEGSFRKMIEANQNYIIDAINLRLTVTSELAPSLPGILLIMMKICGLQLFAKNQLVDVLSQMFVLIDNYHGYSFLVEGFFVVFHELVAQISGEYMKKQQTFQIQGSKKDENSSRYKPWGMTTINQLVQLLDDSQKLVDPFEQDVDLDKEYFKRKPDTPFDEQVADSDDEIDSDDENDQGEASDSNEWSCSIPKNIYMTIQRIFTYGLRLLNHESTSLKVQILKTLSECYPILCENYSLVLPIIADYWSNLLVLIAGSTTLSEFQENQWEQVSYETVMLIIPALEFVIHIINHDKHEGFLSGRFLESWSFISSHSPVFKKEKSKIGKPNQSTAVTSIQMDPRMRFLYRKRWTNC
ncbi:uncharacterized protein KQ657_002998 [Scheffersomyces spartinae]|uniref:TEL2-interacting protein 1 n=1 Tax=Scheffersomyces spartinae TaxID=45513 RepID=A0A9P8AG14_9ASCO|nr:uncharacterized protein KQ657_002998 [Scheffersomyces spartinae]KAG7191603.1 hypothetical protein KQ657_002998 [Scheffersomyces spartinae]